MNPPAKEIILATTTSTRDTGLLDVLVPMFEKSSGYIVKTVAVGSGQAMTMGERGEADVLLVHSPAAEQKFMADGHGSERWLVMHNDFILIGPPSDPAGVKGMRSAAEALKQIVEKKALFVSRGDNSGTHAREKELWRSAGISPAGNAWYQETGQGMGETLNIANEKDGYTLADRGTYLARKSGLRLEIVVEGEGALLNVYHVIHLNHLRHTNTNADGGAAFARFMVSKEAQDVIRTFGVDKYGSPLFFPDAGKSEEELSKNVGAVREPPLQLT